MPGETEFRFSGFNKLIAQGRDTESRGQLSKLERGFCAAADLDTNYVMEGYLHSFIYRAERVPDAIWFFEFIGASAAALPIKETYLALQGELGEPGPDGFGDAVFKVAESSPEWEARFEAWDRAYKGHSDWSTLFETFLEQRGIDPKLFW